LSPTHAAQRKAGTVHGEDLKAAIDRLALGAKAVRPTDLRGLGVVLEQIRSIHDRAEAAGFAGIASVTDGLRVLMEKLIVQEVPDQHLAMRVFLRGISLLHIRQEKSGNWTEQLDLWKASVASLGILFHSLDSQAEESSSVDRPKAPPQQLFDRGLCQEFASEALGHLGQIEVHLISLEQNPGDSECIDAIFRPFHNIKGVSGFLNLTQINRFAHEIESLIDGIRDNRLRVTPVLIDFVLSAVDQMKAMILDLKQSLETGSSLTSWDLAPYLEKIRHLGATLSGKMPLEPQPIGEILVESGTATPDDVRVALDTQRGGSEDRKLGEILIASGKTKPRHVAEALRQQRAENSIMDPTRDGHEALKVDSAKLDILGDLVEQLVDLQSTMSAHPSKGAAQDQEMSSLTRIIAELHEVVMSLRMVQIHEIFQRMVRLVRGLSKGGGKQVELLIEGGDVEIDRNITEVLYDPLVHMIRNAVDHGIEPPAVRKRAGKREHGCVSLRAYDIDDQTVIEVRDDGQGLDRERILSQARDRELVGKDDVLTDNEIDNLIFHPGLSTSEKVTLVSGRGVGMDIVKRAVEGLGGVVEIQSQPGQGTAFTIRLFRTVGQRWAGGSADESGRPHPEDAL
jgi:two-component system chemotaxis sensor kinase CheA